MSKVEDGGPAYPSVNDITADNFKTSGHAGLSIRDYFAAHCPIAFTEFLVGWKKTNESTTTEAMQRYAGFRFEYADAMIAARAESEAS
jgi:hypothetical protein